MTLPPGTALLTGAPEASTSPATVLIRPAMQIRIEIDRVGVLANHISA
jgi:hypothetical protein